MSANGILTNDGNDVLGKMVMMTKQRPSWETEAGLLMLLSMVYGCSTIFNRFLFSMGSEVTESLFLLEVLIPCGIIIFSLIIGLDRAIGLPVNLGRFSDPQILRMVVPCAILFAIRNTFPAYSLSMAKQGNIRDYVFCTRILQPIFTFVLECLLTTRRLWKWHIVTLFLSLSGISIFLFHTFDAPNSNNTVPLLGALSNPLAVGMNLLCVVCGSGFFVLFARISSMKVGNSHLVPFQDLVCFHFIVACGFQVIASLITDTFKEEFHALSLDDNNEEMLQRILVAAFLNMTMLFLRMVCLAKTSCLLTSLVPIYFILPIRLLMGNPVTTTSLIGIGLATLGLVGFLSFTFSEYNALGAPAGWIRNIIDLDSSQIVESVTHCVGVIYGVAFFSILFPIMCQHMLGLSTRYFWWSVFLFALPLCIINHLFISKRKSVAALYICIGLLMFTFMPIQFGPINGAPAIVCFVFEVAVIAAVGEGLNALQIFNGYRPGVVAYSEDDNEIDKDRNHDAELDAVVAKFTINDEDDLL